MSFLFLMSCLTFDSNLLSWSNRIVTPGRVMMRQASLRALRSFASFA